MSLEFEFKKLDLIIFFRYSSLSMCMKRDYVVQLNISNLNYLSFA